MKNLPKTKKTPRSRGSYVDARNYALKLLHYRPRSRKEILERLKKKGFDDKQITSTLQFLEDTGLIKDDVLAAGLLRHAVERKYLGRKGIEAFLCRRGIERELIIENLLCHTKEIEKETANRLVNKKLKTLKNYPEDVVKRKLMGMLQRRGFSANVIKMTVKSLKL